MKFKLLLAAIALIFGSMTVSYASFPVQTTTNSTTNTEEQVDTLEAADDLVGGKSQLTALLLAIFVGGIGIHRFYLGYTWQGVVQLLTLGACGIWSLIDLIRIITGDLKPKSGNYSKTL